MRRAAEGVPILRRGRTDRVGWQMSYEIDGYRQAGSKQEAQEDTQSGV
jgi:hypothetical protein